MDRIAEMRGDNGQGLAPIKISGSEGSGRLAPATPMESEIPEKIMKTVCNHMGINKDQVKRNYDLISLGELHFVAHRERKPSTDETEVVLAESIAHEVDDATRLGPEARAVHAWEAGLLLAEYFREHGRPIVSGRNIIEVGAGVGLVGFSAAEVAMNSKFTLTDGNDTAVSILHTNKELNSAWFGPEADKAVHIRTMKWSDKQDVDDTMAMYGPFNTVIGADVVYSVPAAESLAKLLPRLLADAPRSDAAPKPLILIAHEVRHKAMPGGALSGRDDALNAFLSALCLPVEQGGQPGAHTHQWELACQVLHKEGDNPYNAQEPAKPDVSKISNMPRTESGTAINARDAMSRSSNGSKPNLTVDAHVRAIPLPAPTHRGGEDDHNVEPTAKEIIEQAVRQPHGSYLLLTLSPMA